MYTDIIDISWPITSDITTYKNRGSVEINTVKSFDVDCVRETQITLGSHVGTHIDAPAHFISDGLTVDQMSLGTYIGQCKVLDMTSIPDVITREDLEHYDINTGDIIVCKTRNSACRSTDPFNHEFIYLDYSGAEYLVEKRVKAVGIDYLGIERNQPKHETHTMLMRAGIAIIEGLRLAHVPAGTYLFIALPLAIVGTEAAPARAILMK